LRLVLVNTILGTAQDRKPAGLGVGDEIEDSAFAAKHSTAQHSAALDDLVYSRQRGARGRVSAGILDFSEPAQNIGRPVLELPVAYSLGDCAERLL